MDSKQPTTDGSDPYQIPPEYQVYLDPDFDPQEFANSVLNNEPYHATDISQFASGDVSAVLSKLNLGIEDITKQIRSQVSTHHLKLLTKASAVASLERPLQAVKDALHQLDANVERLHKKIGNRHATLEDALARLDRYQAAAELSRKTSRFVTLAKRLEAQMAELDLSPPNLLLQKDTSKNPSISRDQHELFLAESALTLSELERLLDSELETASIEGSAPAGEEPSPQTLASIRSLTAIQPHVQTIVSARKKVEEQMSRILNQGLVQLDRAMLSSSFQTAYNLSILDRSVGSMIFELTELIGKKIKLAFDLNSLAREAGANDPQPTSSFGYKSRARTEPTAATLPQWTSTLWARLEGLIDDLSTSCVKVYTLEKVLEWKKDPVSGVPFLEVVTSSGSMLEERPSTVFWTTLSSALSKETRETLRTSNFIAQTLTANYPHLLRLFQEFFSRISLHTHTIYNSSSQSPETILTLRAVLPLENIYLNRVMTKMTDAGNGRAEKLTTVLANELDAARFDPLLVRSVCRKAKEVVDNYLKRVENRIVTDYQATSLAGPSATPSQITNIDIFNNLSELSRQLVRALHDYPEEIKKLMEGTIELAGKMREGIIRPIVASITRELNMIISKMHVQFRPTNASSNGMYMQELRAKLALVRHELLARLEPAHLEPLLLELTAEVLGSFLFHASLMTPLTETLKLRLAGEVAELEFEVTQFLVHDQARMGPSLRPPGIDKQPHDSKNNNDNEDDDDDGEAREERRMEVARLLDDLKIFRQVLFADTASELSLLLRQSTLDVLLVVHILLVKHQSDFPSASDKAHPQVLLIHQRNAWTAPEYARWVQEYRQDNRHREPLRVFRSYLDEVFDEIQSVPDDRLPELQWLRLARQFLE
ncbi:hypothetical protein PtA15_11A510 [Puccinia triticina]|uniref:Conserved oligomeric Golgi complex subunit 5 n=1 Tax=Puccinia triticina TaxID=208348 RepID=A0ABY7CWZ3_9BASI|nr:uncharacterized protein PtA15_11A510 [Puccinia triticina]WAQ89819.1 hypothetical protein PtA15_11A510 [Puccinia triticina]